MGHDLEELNCPAQTHDLNPTEQIFNEREHRLQAWPSYPTSLSDLINVLFADWGMLVKNNLISVVFRIQEQQCVQGVLTSHFWVNKNE